MRAGRACICALYGAAKCDSRRKRVAENREAQGIVRPCTLCFISPLWGGRRAQRSEHVGWGPPPEIASQFRPPHKGEVEGALIHSRFRDDGETLHPIDQKGNAKRSATFDRRLLSGRCTFDRRNADPLLGPRTSCPQRRCRKFRMRTGGPRSRWSLQFLKDRMAL